MYRTRDIIAGHKATLLNTEVHVKY